MTETIRYTKLFADDIAFGTSTQNVELQNGEVVAMEELNLTHLHASNNHVLYASSDGTTDATFNFDAANNRLFVPEIAGGSTSGDDVRIKGTTHATPGFVTLNEGGGNVGIGTTTPTALLHLSAASPEILVNESSTGDPAITFSLSDVDKFVMGIDNSDGDLFKIENGGVLGAANDFVLATDGRIGLGTSAPAADLHVFIGPSSATMQADADNFIIETGGNSGMTIASLSTGTSRIRFSDSVSGTAGAIAYDHNNDRLSIDVNAAEVARFDTNGQLLLGTTTTSAFVTGSSITIDAETGKAMLFQDTVGVAHGMTSIADTGTYGHIQQVASDSGGISLQGFSEATVGVSIEGYITTESTADADATGAAVEVVGHLRSGTASTTLGATGNLFSVRNEATTVFIVNGDGDVSNSGGSTAMAIYDDYDDTKLLKAVKGAMDGTYRERLGEWVDEHLAILEAGGIITRHKSGQWFISQRGWRGLLIDAIGQLDARLRALESPGIA